MIYCIYFAVEFVVDCTVDHCLNAGPCALAHLMNIKLAGVIKHALTRKRVQSA